MIQPQEKKALTNFVCDLSSEQAEKLKNILEEQGKWGFSIIPYSLWQARHDHTTVTAFKSGKLSIQGRNTEELVEFIIEPRIIQRAAMGYEIPLAQQDDPQMFDPHAGIDESGKGDFFGPLVIACVYVDRKSATTLLELGVKDSKVIKSEKKIAFLADRIKKITRNQYALVVIGPESYNRLYRSMKNVNRLLAWGHARSLENLLDIVSDCPRAISDQFGNKKSVLNALLEKGKRIVLIQQTKAESDIAVAAASIIARHEFVTQLKKLEEKVGMRLPKGASLSVIDTAIMLMRAGEKQGNAEVLLNQCCKTHFRTMVQAARKYEDERSRD